MARYTVDFDESFNAVLDGLAKEKKVTKAEILRRAVASYSYMDKQVNEAEGKKISVTDANDKIVKDVILP